MSFVPLLILGADTSLAALRISLFNGWAKMRVAVIGMGIARDAAAWPNPMPLSFGKYRRAPRGVGKSS